ncbi:MAG: HepT-like ribonuclease domain-containing protein [Cyanobacteria bacterium J06634_5]
MYEIIVIGEAANRLSEEFRLEHSNIPWKEIVGMRNILAHQYETVDAEVVWDAAVQDVPDLLKMIEPLL